MLQDVSKWLDYVTRNGKGHQTEEYTVVTKRQLLTSKPSIYGYPGVESCCFFCGKGTTKQNELQ